MTYARRGPVLASLAALLLFVAGRCLVPMDETDLFFNLRLGDLTLAAHAVPRTNLLSFTWPDVRDLNLAHRAACLPLGGAENLTGANQACLWQSGYPLRTSFGTGAPRHDPFLHSAARLIESGEADALLWISTLGSAVSAAMRPDLPLILLAPPEEKPAVPPAVFLPVGRPGIDHAGQIFRGDGIVALPLTALRPSSLHSAGETLRAIVAAMGAAAMESA